MGVKGREGLVCSHNPRPHYMWDILQLRFACLCMIMIALSVRTVQEIITKCIFSVFNLPDIIQLIGLSLKCNITLSTAGQITATTAIIGNIRKNGTHLNTTFPLDPVKFESHSVIWQSGSEEWKLNYYRKTLYVLLHSEFFMKCQRSGMMCRFIKQGTKNIFNDSQINGNIYSRVFCQCHTSQVLSEPGPVS